MFAAALDQLRAYQCRCVPLPCIGLGALLAQGLSVQMFAPALDQVTILLAHVRQAQGL